MDRINGDVIWGIKSITNHEVKEDESILYKVNWKPSLHTEAEANEMCPKLLANYKKFHFL